MQSSITDNFVEETIKHINLVARNIRVFCDFLANRGLTHDSSKFSEPERSIFEKTFYKLKDTTFGSPEYDALLDECKEAVDHHRKHNRHHPEFHEDGISSMNLIDIIELFCDWRAATLKHYNGNFEKSIEINAKRYNMSDQLVRIFENTRKDLKW